MVPLPAPLPGLWYYTVSAVVFIMQTWTVCISHIRPFPIHTAISYFFHFIILLVLVWYMDWGFCWGVWCAISGIIKLTINDFFALKLTVVLHSGLQSVVLFIFHIFCVHMDLFSLSLCLWNHSQFISIDALLSHPISPSTSTWAKQTCARTADSDTCTLAHKHCKHRRALHTHCSIHQPPPPPRFLLILCVLSPYLFTSTFSLPHNQHAPRNTHKLGETHTRTEACTHKVARLVGAMAAALLRSPRVAPGARLPVVCQRLRVEFIQIKVVEWGPSPRMPRPSPSSAFRRWE